MPESPSQETDPHRLNLPVVAGALRAGTASNKWLGRWLPQSYIAPERFQETLRAQVALRRGGIKSSPSGVVDLYHDCVLAHVGQQKRALIVREAGKDRELSYDTLHKRSGELANAWREAGVVAGQSLCLLLPLGIDYAVALLTALRMGLIVCALPTHGPTFVRNRLVALAPDAVVVADNYRQLVQSLKLPILSLVGTQELSAQGSHGYAPDEPVLRLFSPFGDTGLEPVEVAAAQLHTALLRDAFLVFALDAKDTLALPGFEPLTCQPTSLLMVLLAGASWAEFQPAEVTQVPGVLQEHGVTLLGVSRQLRNLLISFGKWPSTRLRAWCRNLTERLELSAWDELGKLSVDAGLPSFNAAFSAAAGGVLLFGPVLKQPLTLQVWPPPGQSWQLSEVAAGQLPALSDAGVYAPLLGEELVQGVPRLLLARTDEGYLCTGCIDVGPDASLYPSDEVSTLVAGHAGVEYASVVVSPGRAINEAHVTLLVFVEEAEKAASPAARALSPPELVALVKREMGEMFAPERVEIFPLRPRLVEGSVDHAWCRSQYLSGALGTKTRREIFRLLSRLGYLLDTRHEVAAG